MALAPGDHAGHYVVTALIGRGGMGEVYRARDTRLQRDVALKILPARFATDPERLARLEREAHLLASLNHPHIAAIHGFEDVGVAGDGAGASRALVMELVEGPTLAEHLGRGALTLDEAVPIAIGIAEALEAAHERGIIHRDLKPANVKIAPDGTVKVLDFGLAKALEPASAQDASAGQAVSQSPTLTSPALTEAGMILGTAAYMSPEQARGKSVDRRADVWAFGCVLFEMLSGRPAFASEGSVSDTLAGILKGEPQWALLPPTTPPAIRSLVERCLRKEARRRLPDVGAARIELEDARNAPAASPPPGAGSGIRIWQGVTLVAVVVAGTVAFAWWNSLFRIPVAGVARFEIPTGVENATDAGSGISPDGRAVMFTMTTKGVRQIWIRPIDGFRAVALADSDLASRPFWSADSQYLAFFAEGKLKKIPAAGGAPLVVADVPGREGTWGKGNVILIGGQGKGLVQVPASGGTPAPATELGPNELTHDYPEFLPDGRHFVYLARRGPNLTDWDVYVGSLDSKERHLLPGIHAGPKYSPSGHLLYLRDGSLVGQPFDLARLTLTGDAFALPDRVSTPGGPRPFFSISSTGTLVYENMTSNQDSQLAWFDRTGRQQTVIGQSAEFSRARLSPDGRSLAFDRGLDIFILDIDRGLTNRVVSTPAADLAPVWSPDGRRIAFASSREPTNNFSLTNAAAANLYERPAGVQGSETLLLKTKAGKVPHDWSQNGRYLAYTEAADVWALPIGVPGQTDPVKVTATPFPETEPRFSPDSRWIAYQANEPGANAEVWVQSFPEGTTRQQVSVEGGVMPRWRPNSSELYYVTPDFRLMSVTIALGDSSLQIGKPVQLFQSLLFQGAAPYEISADGRFLLNVRRDHGLAPISVVFNWTNELRK
jgi:serine/threonine protein kinase/Tol biopolymer transport system component